MREALEKIIKLCVKPSLAIAKVIEVKSDSCTVELEEDRKKLYKVSYTPLIQNENNYLKAVPKVGSTVVVGMSEDSSFIVSVSEAETIEYKQGETHFTVDKNGYKIERDGENLMACLEDYIDEVNKIIVVNGTSINVGATNAIKKRIKKILI